MDVIMNNMHKTTDSVFFCLLQVNIMMDANLVLQIEANGSLTEEL